MVKQIFKVALQCSKDFIRAFDFTVHLTLKASLKEIARCVLVDAFTHRTACFSIEVFKIREIERDPWLAVLPNAKCSI